MSEPSGSAPGVLLVVIGVLLLTQTLVGGLVERILGLSHPASTPSKTSRSKSSSAKTGSSKSSSAKTGSSKSGSGS